MASFRAPGECSEGLSRVLTQGHRQPPTYSPGSLRFTTWGFFVASTLFCHMEKLGGSPVYLSFTNEPLASRLQDGRRTRPKQPRTELEKMYWRAFGWEFYLETLAQVEIFLDCDFSIGENHVWCLKWHLVFNRLEKQEWRLKS